MRVRVERVEPGDVVETSTGLLRVQIVEKKRRSVTLWGKKIFQPRRMDMRERVKFGVGSEVEVYRTKTSS